jgi:LuxR family maltose regulon positive regulatory protein
LLLNEWIRHSKWPTAWVSLDEGDNDPVRFWTHFIAALQAARAGMTRDTLVALQPPGLPPGEPFLTVLINETAKVACAVVLDDYHLIHSQPIHDALTFLLDRLPPRMRLVIASREEPPLPLARLRARGELVELRAADLSFTLDEAATLLNRLMGLGLPDDDVAALEARTEGWVAGLQMAALSLQGRQDSHRLITGLSGGHRFIFDYLMGEVFSRQPEKVRSFLLQTAILDSLTGSLCDSVTNRCDSQAILERLEAANLFIVPLDEERHWYRYHHLFAGLLRRRLQKESPDVVPVLHRQASEWYEREGLLSEAFRHALAGQDIPHATRLAEENSPRALERGELTTALGWIETLPDEVVRSRPVLLCVYGWGLYLTGQIQAAETHLQHAERVLMQRAASPLAADEQDGLAAALGDIALLRLFLTRYFQGPRSTVDSARKALESVPEQRYGICGLIYLVLGLALAESGSLTEAIQAHAEALRLLQKSGRITSGGMTAVSQLARLYLLQGQLHRAAAVCQQALQSAETLAGSSMWRVPASGLVFLGMGAVLYEWNELDTAARHIEEGIVLGEQGGYLEIMKNGYLMLACVKQARGDAQGALDAMLKAEQALQKVSAPRGLAEVAAHRVRLSLAQGNLEAAKRWAQETQLDEPIMPVDLREYQGITLARVLVAQGRVCPKGPYLVEATRLLSSLLESALAGGRMGRGIEILLLQALALDAQGQHKEALAALARALSLAMPEGYVRLFADEGEPVRALLQQLAPRDTALGPIVGKLLAVLRMEQSQLKGKGVPATPAASRRTTAKPSPLVEPLTERELEVLRLVAAGLSTRRIAEELYLSVNTVKTHVKSLYSKLNVHSRAQAIKCARELGLL